MRKILTILFLLTICVTLAAQTEASDNCPVEFHYINPQQLKNDERLLEIDFGPTWDVFSIGIEKVIFGAIFYDGSGVAHPASHDFEVQGDRFSTEVELPNPDWELASGGVEIWVKEAVLRDGRRWTDDGSHLCKKIRRSEIPNIVNRYDKFKDITQILLGKRADLTISLGDLNTLSLNVLYTCLGQSTSCKPDSVRLSFLAVSDGWRFIKDDRFVTFMVDGERVPVGKADWDGETSEGGTHVLTYETMALMIPVPTLRRIANGRIVEGQIGHRDFIVSDLLLNAVRSFPLLQTPTQPSPAIRRSRAEHGSAKHRQ